MRRNSHLFLGHYLIYRYLKNAPSAHRRAFLLGCIQPDKNPSTYLKGSFRHQWLRGHNYPNSSRFMTRIARRLEGKKSMNLFDFYTLGKLIHYTADAFTAPHNQAFSGDLYQHREYEKKLEQYFLQYLQQDPAEEVLPGKSIPDSIRMQHCRYSAQIPDIYRDSHFALQTCCLILASLQPVPIR